MDFAFTLATYRLDALALLLLAAGGMLAVHLWARRMHGVAVARVGWLLLLVFVLAGTGLAEWLAGQTRQQLRTMLNGFAATYAFELERLGHARIANDAAPDDPTYLRLIEIQKQWL